MSCFDYLRLKGRVFDHLPKTLKFGYLDWKMCHISAEALNQYENCSVNNYELSKLENTSRLIYDSMNSAYL